MSCDRARDAYGLQIFSPPIFQRLDVPGLDLQMFTEMMVRISNLGSSE